MLNIARENTVSERAKIIFIVSHNGAAVLPLKAKIRLVKYAEIIDDWVE